MGAHKIFAEPPFSINSGRSVGGDGMGMDMEQQGGCINPLLFSNLSALTLYELYDSAKDAPKKLQPKNANESSASVWTAYPGVDVLPYVTDVLTPYVIGGDVLTPYVTDFRQTRRVCERAGERERELETRGYDTVYGQMIAHAIHNLHHQMIAHPIYDLHHQMIAHPIHDYT